MTNHTRLFKQICKRGVECILKFLARLYTVVDVASDNLAVRSKLDADKLAETRRVVVANGLGISKRLQQWVSLDDLLLEKALGDLLARLAARASNRCEVLDNLLCVFRLTGTRLAPAYVLFSTGKGKGGKLRDKKRLVLELWLLRGIEVRSFGITVAYSGSCHGRPHRTQQRCAGAGRGASCPCTCSRSHPCRWADVSTG